MPKYLDYHGLETLTNDIEATYLRKNQKGVANGVATLDSNGKVPSSQIPSGTGGTTDYDDLTDKPQINGVTLAGNKTTSNLGIHDVPSGGTTGQILSKASGTNYDVEWTTPAEPASPEDIVVVSDSTPTDPDARIWFPETAPQSVSIPTTAELQAVTDSIAPDYSDLTFPVAAGKACIHEGTRYVANQAIQLSETWTAAHWDEESVEEALSSQKTEITNKVDKSALDNAGITNKTYTTKCNGQFSVTTATDQDWLNPHARASVTGKFYKGYLHSVTFDGTEYILPSRLWYENMAGGAFKVYEYLGNLGLYVSDISGVPGGTDDVPFVIISDLDDNSSIDVLTQTAGTYSILIKQITPVKTDIPKSLIYGNEYAPIEKKEADQSTYNGFSIGVNELKNKRGTFAIGYANKITDQFSYTIGERNEVAEGFAFGDRNTSSSGYAFGLSNEATNNGTAIGSYNKADDYSVAIGSSLTAKFGATAIGIGNVEPVGIPVWSQDTYYTAGELVKYSNLPTPFVCAQDHTSSSDFVTDFTGGKWQIKMTTLKTDAVLLVGNGEIDSNSNALKIDLNGNAYFNGNIYAGCNPDSTGGTRIATVDEINPVETVSGTTPSITGVAGHRYICGEVSTLSIAPPQSGDIEVIFESGSTATVLTVPNTVKFPPWFDPTDLEANVTYDIIITNGTLGVVTSWV